MLTNIKFLPDSELQAGRYVDVPSQAIGKVIKDVVSSNRSTSIIIIFDDGTFSYLKPGDSDEYSDPYIEEEEIRGTEDLVYDYGLVKAGVGTKEEYDAAKATAEKRWAEQRAEQERSELAKLIAKNPEAAKQMLAEQEPGYARTLDINSAHKEHPV